MATEDTALPAYWEKCVLAAYLLMMGETWERAARAVGRSRRTIANWKQNTVVWEEAKAEAERRWLSDIKNVARRAVHRQLAAGDGDLGLKVLERTVDEFSPKARREGIHPQVLQVLVQKVLVYLSDEQAQELLDFLALQLAPARAPRLAAAPGGSGRRTGNQTHSRQRSLRPKPGNRCSSC